MPELLWGVTHKWADAILFGHTRTTAKKEHGQSKAKAQGGTERVIRTTRTAAYDAGNRYNLPDEINCGRCAKDAWTAFAEAMKRRKE